MTQHPHCSTCQRVCRSSVQRRMDVWIVIGVVEESSVHAIPSTGTTVKEALRTWLSYIQY